MGNLVLQRKELESLVIGEEVIVTVVRLRGDAVRLMISAPDEVPIHRLEIANIIRHDRGLPPLVAPGLSGPGEGRRG